MSKPIVQNSVHISLCVAVLFLHVLSVHIYAQDATAIAKEVFPSLVLIETRDFQGQPLAQGSGFFVRPDVIATNYHVIEGAKSGTVKVVGETSVDAIIGVLAFDKKKDLALLKVATNNRKPLTLADFSKIEVGQAIFALGNPRGLEGTISPGIISSNSLRQIEAEDLIQITAPISPGSSGGPIVNSKGEVIGVAVGSLTNGQNLNFAIPSAFLAILLANMKALVALSDLNKSTVATRPPETKIASEPTPSESAPTSPITKSRKSKDDSFKDIAALLSTKKPEDMAKAYPLSKDFLARFGKDDKDENVKRIRIFVSRYREHEFMVALDANKIDVAFPLGKEILAEQPDNVGVLLNMAYAGYTALSGKGDKTYVDDSLGYGKKTIELMEAGTMPKAFAPFKDKEETISFMYFVVGNLMLEKDKKEAAANLYKATLFESQIKTNSAAYYLIAVCYEDLYTKFAADLKAKLDSKKISDADFTAESARVARIIDLMMDAYARAVKLGEADKNPDQPQWKQRLTQVYKFARKSEAGLTEYINQVITTPMPDPGKF